jgi:predicted RNase H-like HicB family nuclease
MEAISAALTRVKPFSVSTYVEEALKRADYYRDENGVVIARVPAASGFFAQGETFEEARANLRDVIEGNLLLALQLGLEIPKLACRVRSSCVPKLIREIIDEVGISRDDWLAL